MSVPKCKECKFHSRSYSLAHPRSPHYCENTDNPDTKQLYAMHKRLILKHIYSCELQTSPKWCPKRLKESEVN